MIYHLELDNKTTCVWAPHPMNGVFFFFKRKVIRRRQKFNKIKETCWCPRNMSSQHYFAKERKEYKEESVYKLWHENIKPNIKWVWEWEWKNTNTNAIQHKIFMHKNVCANGWECMNVYKYLYTYSHTYICRCIHCMCMWLFANVIYDKILLGDLPLITLLFSPTPTNV